MRVRTVFAITTTGLAVAVAAYGLMPCSSGDAGRDGPRSTPQSESSVSSPDASATVSKNSASSSKRNAVTSAHGSEDESLEDVLDRYDDQLWTQLRAKNLKQAEELVEEIRRVAPYSRAYYKAKSLSTTYSDLATYVPAIPEMRRCVELYPEEESCQTSLMIGLSLSGEVKDLLAAAQRCRDILPNLSSCLGGLAEAHLRNGSFGTAVSEFQELEKVNAKEEHKLPQEMIEYQLASALYGAGQFEEAAIRFKSACEAKWPGACERSQELR